MKTTMLLFDRFLGYISVLLKFTFDSHSPARAVLIFVPVILLGISTTVHFALMKEINQEQYKTVQDAFKTAQTQELKDYIRDCYADGKIDGSEYYSIKERYNNESMIVVKNDLTRSLNEGTK